MGSYYIYSFDGKLMAEYDMYGQWVRDYIYMGNQLVAEYKGTTYYYYTSDQVNSTRIVTDGTGAVTYAAAYDPYGGIQKTWGTPTYTPTRKFSGKERDAESGLDYFGARYYDHLKYRFLSPDPIMNRAKLIPTRISTNTMGINQGISYENTDITKQNEKSEEDALSNPQLWNLYAFNRNNPIAYFDPDGRSSLTFNRSSQTLTLYDNSGSAIGTYNASNNAGSNQWAANTFTYSWHSPHQNAQESDAISSSGIYIFNVPGHTGMGVHAGRAGVTDSAGRTGWEHETEGCIRTTEEAMTAIRNRFQANDPLTQIIVND